MKRKLHQGDFINQEIENIKERVINWSYAVHADAQMWDEVIKDKWRLAAFYQTGE